MSIAQGLGSFVGPPIAGLVFDATGSYSLIIYIIAIGYLISGISCCAAAYAHRNQLNEMTINSSWIICNHIFIYTIIPNLEVFDIYLIVLPIDVFIWYTIW